MPRDAQLDEGQVSAKAPMAAYRDEVALSSLVRAYAEWSHLKQLYRAGWLRRGVPPERCESVADHSFGVAVLALFLLDAHHPEMDRDKVLRMALLHDFGETYAGDVTPSDAVLPEEKHRRESESVERVLGKLPRGDEYVALWEEYETGATPEARFVREVDRLEMGLQASVYERQGLADLSEFYDSVEEALSLSSLCAVLQELVALRSQ